MIGESNYPHQQFRAIGRFTDSQIDDIGFEGVLRSSDHLVIESRVFR